MQAAQETNEKAKTPILSFARGSVTYWVLALAVLIALITGIFESERIPGNPKIIGSFGKCIIIEREQGENVYEITVRKKDSANPDEMIEIEKVSDLLWIIEHSHSVKTFHPIEKNGKIYGLIITVN